MHNTRWMNIEQNVTSDLRFETTVATAAKGSRRARRLHAETNIDINHLNFCFYINVKNYFNEIFGIC